MYIEQETNDQCVIHGPTMGTRFSAIFVPTADFDLEQIEADLQAAVENVDQQMSTWKSNSDLMQLNGTTVGEWHPLPKELFEVLTLSEQVRKASNGAFDVTIGALIDAWGFGPDNDQPDAKALGEFATMPNGFAEQALHLDGQALSARRLQDRKIDLCGIAKGYGVDQMANVLLDRGITDFLVSIDGELRASGKNADDKNWSIGVEKPLAGERQIAEQFELHDLAVATSGNYRHFFEIGDNRISHTMDPKCARPVANKIASVTVFANTCAAADAWATAIWVGGYEMLDLAKKGGHIVDAIILDENSKKIMPATN